MRSRTRPPQPSYPIFAPSWGTSVGAWLAGLSLGASLALLNACGSAPMPRQELRELYDRAIADVLEVEPSEVVEDLVVIRPGAPGLEWAADGRVLVTTWAKESWLRKPGRHVTLRTEVWVVPGHGVRERCRRIETSEAELRLRLEQMLGLPPGSGSGRRFVELWVRPADLFRPCPDPAIDQVRCTPEVDPEQISPEHREWLAEAAEDLHRPARAGGYPWTGLGYTYDWGHPYTEVGFTELVVRRRADVRVRRVETTAKYCRAQ